jgi:hypothetical protein
VTGNLYPDFLTCDMIYRGELSAPRFLHLTHIFLDFKISPFCESCIFLVVDSPVSEFDFPTFRNIKFRTSRGITQKKEYSLPIFYVSGQENVWVIRFVQTHSRIIEIRPTTTPPEYQKKKNTAAVQPLNVIITPRHS